MDKQRTGLGGRTTSRSWAPVVIGSAALWAWGFLAFLSPALIPASLGSKSSGLEIGFFVSQGTVVVLVAALLLLSRKRPLLVGRGTLLLCALALTGATLLIPGALVAHNLGAVVGCSIVCGAAATFLSAAWGARYSLEPRDVSGIVLLSFFVAYGIYLGTVYLVPPPFAGAIVIVLPLVSWVLWLADASARHGVSTEVFPLPASKGADAMPGEMTAGVWESRVLPWRTIGVIVVASFIGNTVSSLIMGTSYEGADSLFPGGLVVCSCIVLMALIPLTADHEAFTVAQLYRVTITFTAVGLVLIMVLGQSGLAMGGALVQGCAMFLQALIYVVVTRSTRVEGLSPLLSFGVGQAVIAGILLAGNLLGKQLFLMGGSSTFTLNAVCGIGLLALFFMLVAQVSRHGIMHVEEATGGEAQGQARPGSTSTLNSRYDEAAELAQSSLQGEDVPPVAYAQATSEPSTDSHLEGFSHAYGLTAREAEILGYLVRGRNLPYIANELFVTTGTIKTHVRHIYAKAGVGSRQELLDAIEHFEAN